MAELEERYIVLKCEDIDRLSFSERSNLHDLCRAIGRIREARGKNPNKKYIVVSEDWPMYQETVENVLDYAEEQEISGNIAFVESSQ